MLFPWPKVVVKNAKNEMFSLILLIKKWVKKTNNIVNSFKEFFPYQEVGMLRKTNNKILLGNIFSKNMYSNGLFMIINFRFEGQVIRYSIYTHLKLRPVIACSKLTIEKLQHGIFIVNFERISHLVLVFLLLTLSR